ncbi:MAG TPA: hypothetical protein VIY51_25905 [Xanthobacteraceae bacterium]
MNHRLLGLLAAGVVVALPAAASAQANRTPHYYSPTLRDDEQIMPSQVVAPPPVKPKPAPKPVVAKPPPPVDDPSLVEDPDAAAKPAALKPAAPPKPAEPARAVACSAGAFAKRSDHLKLAQAYGVHNVDFAQVTGDDGSAMMASVLFPNDPKRRLEVLWDDDAQRAGTRMIVIEGQSTWAAQKGVRLGLPLAALEKLNGKPFKLVGFEKDGGMAVVSDWNGGALSLLTDGCKIGVQFKPDPKAPPTTLSAAGSDKEFASSDPAIRAAKPVIGEIIVAY